MPLSSTEVKFLNAIKFTCQSQMKNNKILASVTAAQSIQESQWGTAEYIINTNNLFRLLADYKWKGKCYSLDTKELYDRKADCTKSDTLIRIYDSFAQSIEDRTTYILEARKSKNGPLKYQNVIGVTDYKKCIKMYIRDNYVADQLNGYNDPNYESIIIELIEKYELYKWDEEVLDGTFEANNLESYAVKADAEATATLFTTKSLDNAKSMAATQRGYKVYNKNNELVDDPWVIDESSPMYRVRLSWELDGSQLIATKVIEDAKEEADKRPGYKVFEGDEGTMIYDPWKKEETPAKDNITTEVGVKEIKTIISGGSVVLNKNTPLYGSPEAKNPFGFVGGECYYYDGKIYNGRTRITKTNNPKYINGKDPSKVLGFINI